MERMKQILETVGHRPWALPEGNWTMVQRWHDLLFAHWPVKAESMRALLPEGLELDTFDGDAWVGVVPFRMSGIRLRLLPTLPWVSAFCELNVRTYVTRDSKPGVYFFSLDAANPVAVAVARRWYHLPYFRAEMSLQENEQGLAYRSLRTHRGAPSAVFRCRYRPAGDVYRAEPGSLEHWLTERYCLYTADASGAYRAEIHHRPWPLQPAEAEIEDNTMAAAAGIEPADTQPLLHFAREILVPVWTLRRI